MWKLLENNLITVLGVYSTLKDRKDVILTIEKYQYQGRVFLHLKVLFLVDFTIHDKYYKMEFMVCNYNFLIFEKVSAQSNGLFLAKIFSAGISCNHNGRQISLHNQC